MKPWKCGKYLKVYYEGKEVYQHLVVWKEHTGEWPNGELDHINGDGTDNRFENLRLCTRSDNCCNRRLFKNNTSGYRNVAWFASEGKWGVRIQKNGVSHFFGYFNDKEEANGVAIEKRKELHGHFFR